MSDLPNYNTFFVSFERDFDLNIILSACCNLRIFYWEKEDERPIYRVYIPYINLLLDLDIDSINFLSLSVPPKCHGLVTSSSGLTVNLISTIGAPKHYHRPISTSALPKYASRRA